MSLQVCHCGWSKHTSYHGLRTHQGKMGCTPKGKRIPESDQFRLNTYHPTVSFMVPPVKLKEPLFSTSINLVTDSSDNSLQICHCGWTKVTSYQGLRIHQGMMGCTPKGMRIPESEQYIWRDQWEESHQNDNSLIHSTLVKKENVLPSSNLKTQTNPAVIGVIKTLVENQQQMDRESDRTHQALDFNTESQPLFMPGISSQIYSVPFATAKDTNKSFFETPQRSHQPATNLDKTRRALDFSTGAEQVKQLVFEMPTTMAQEPAVPPKDKEMEQKEEAQKLLKGRRDRMRAELQQKIQNRTQKVAEVISSVKACKGSLDAEWLEINSVFSEVMKVVEDARQKALQPLEKRRQKVKQKGQRLVQKLEREIEKLKETLDVLDKNPDFQVCPPTFLDESRDWNHVNVDTSFGSLRTTTSVMMEEIQKKLENLSPLELKRITTFEVDVRLDPATAHQCLDISDDGKEVTHGGKNQRLPDATGRFDMFGSILALNGLTSGKSYWEVEVNNKTGWDLGVARGTANRRGKLSLNPDNGYWVAVHYEDKKYAALADPPVSLSLKEKPQKVGVFVDYEEGLVSFYDVTSQSHIYSFTECLFSGEIFPYFSPHLKQNGKNVDPLIISTVKNL